MKPLGVAVAGRVVAAGGADIVCGSAGTAGGLGRVVPAEVVPSTSEVLVGTVGLPAGGREVVAGGRVAVRAVVVVGGAVVGLSPSVTVAGFSRGDTSRARSGSPEASWSTASVTTPAATSVSAATNGSR